MYVIMNDRLEPYYTVPFSPLSIPVPAKYGTPCWKWVNISPKVSFSDEMENGEKWNGVIRPLYFSKLR